MNYLAFDLGAESGRAILAQFQSGILSIREIYRFPNGPVQCRGNLRWDILRLYHEMRRALEASALPQLESMGIDTWGVDYALLGERGNLLKNPHHYRDARTEGMIEKVCAHVSREKIYTITGIQLLPFNTLFQLYAASLNTPRLLDSKEQYAEYGVDVDAAMERLTSIPVSIHCWQGDDVGGFESPGAELSNRRTCRWEWHGWMK